jgi:hypothetical protein
MRRTHEHMIEKYWLMKVQVVNPKKQKSYEMAARGFS